MAVKPAMAQEQGLTYTVLCTEQALSTYVQKGSREEGRKAEKAGERKMG